MDAREKLAVYLVAQFVAVTALAVTVGAMLGHFPFGDPLTRDVAPTTPAVALADAALTATGVVVLLAYLVGVAGVALYARTLADRSRAVAAAGLAVVSLPFLVVVALSGFVVGFAVGQLLTVVLLVAGVQLLAGAVAYALGLFGDRNGSSDGDPDRQSGLGGTATQVIAAVVCLGTLVGLAAAAGGVAPLVASERAGTPVAAFDVAYDPVNETHGVLTVTHSGGDAVPSTELFVRGAETVALDGARQAAGAWAGGTARMAGDRVVLPGNETTVGVTGGCELSVVYQRGGQAPAATTLADYECGGAVD